MTTRIKLRRDTYQNWYDANPTLALGEPGYDTTNNKIKVGDGVTAWRTLEYLTDAAAATQIQSDWTQSNNAALDFIKNKPTIPAAQIQSDWNQASNVALDFIKNKPTIPTDVNQLTDSSNLLGGGSALTSTSSIEVETGDSDRWFVRLRREDQTENPSWNGVTVYSTNYDSDGNAIVVARLSLQDDGIVVFKFTSAGELVWKKSLGSVNDSYYPESNVVIDSDDNIIFAVNPDDSNAKIIVKINGSTGAVIFSNDIDFGQSTSIMAIAVDSSNNIIIGGDSNVVANEAQVAFVAKLNPTATVVTWQRTLNVQYTYSYINSLAVDFNNDIIVGGNCPVVGADSVMFVAKITSAGALGWQKIVALEDVNEGNISGISLDSVGNIYATGSYYVDTGTNQWFGQKSNAIVVFKMTTLGAVVWDRRVGPGECSWVGVSTAVGSDGDLYLYASTYQYRLAGEVNSSNGYWNATLALARYNKATGAVIWQSYFDNPNAQEVPGLGNDAPWGVTATDLMAVQGDKILIGGAVRLGHSGPDQDAPWSEYDYFNQGFLAQFDTASTPWSAEGWTLSTSRIPGKLTNTLVAVTGPAVLQTDVAITTEGMAGITAQAVGVSVRRTASKINTWTFGKDGTFTAPDDANIKLNQRQLGHATMYGLFPNDESDIWFESVCHDADGFAYALGSTWWGPGDRAYMYKFTPEGQLVWSRQLFAGTGATFNISWTGGVFTVDLVVNGGENYKVGDRIILAGSAFGGDVGVNSLTLEVATLVYGTVGPVATVTIVSGLAPAGSSSATDVQDYYENAECQVISMTFDPVTGNPVIVITTPTFNGDTLDSEWTETVALLIDSGSGTVVSTTTLTDQGDIYAKDVAVSSTGNVAIVGEKFDEYQEYGAITPLTGSAVDKLWVLKTDIDAEHFPGEGVSYYGDWWITGSSISDQVPVTNVNYYDGLTGTVTNRPGADAIFSVDVIGGSYANITATNPGSGYLSGQRFKILGTALGGTTPANDLTFTVGVVDGVISGVINPTGTATGIDTSYPGLTPVKVNGSGANFYAQFDATTGAFNYGGINTNSGQDYLAGDVITIAGTSFAGGTSPANDVTVTVTSVGGSGDLQNPVNFSGTHSATHLLITTNATVNYAQVGATFAIKQNLGGEAFVWTREFNKAIGGGNSDSFNGVVWNSTGSHLYAVGTGKYDVTYNQALVVKYSNTGTLEASKFLNDDMNSQWAYGGAVALMANNNIVVVHTQYNPYRDQTDEVLVTKLDSSLNILWQQFIGVNDGDGGWQSPDSPISVAVDPTTDEILLAWDTYNWSIFGDNMVAIVKLDTDGEVLWKRMFGIHESDSGVSYNGNGNKALSIHGDQFTIVGYTDGPDDMTDNAFIVTLPLDGTGVGLHGIWTYVEPNDDLIKVWRLSNRTSTTFTPNVHADGITEVDNLKYYYTNDPNEDFTFYPQTILSDVGGAIEFADGSKQTFSTALVPQVKISAGRYTIRPEDSGRHILVEEGNYAIVIPSWKKVTLPVGFTFTIVNISNNTIYVQNENDEGRMWFSGGNDQTPYVDIADNGSGQMVTLMKIKEGTQSDDSENQADIWMIAGANISNNW